MVHSSNVGSWVAAPYLGRAALVPWRTLHQREGTSSRKPETPPSERCRCRSWRADAGPRFGPHTMSGARVAATDLVSMITLANELRAALVEKGLFKGTA